MHLGPGGPGGPGGPWVPGPGGPGGPWVPGPGGPGGPRVPYDGSHGSPGPGVHNFMSFYIILYFFIIEDALRRAHRRPRVLG